jgi:hypothetical protein
MGRFLKGLSPLHDRLETGHGSEMIQMEDVGLHHFQAAGDVFKCNGSKAPLKLFKMVKLHPSI